MEERKERCLKWPIFSWEESMVSAAAADATAYWPVLLGHYTKVLSFP